MNRVLLVVVIFYSMVTHLETGGKNDGSTLVIRTISLIRYLHMAIRAKEINIVRVAL